MAFDHEVELRFHASIVGTVGRFKGYLGPKQGFVSEDLPFLNCYAEAGQWIA